MLKVLKPNKNKLVTNGGYTKEHRGYDHSGKGDPNYYSSFYGIVVQSKNVETRTWIANSKTDPWYVEGKTRKLTTNDYGNFIKIKGEIDGTAVYQLGAHFKPGTVLEEGTEVKKGQVVAQIGSSGNSSGNHSHTEYRDANEVNFEVEFVDETEEPKPIMEDKRQQIIDIYKGTTGEYPSEDEILARLQQNKNRVELIEDILTGDGRAQTKWKLVWGVNQTNMDNPTVIDEYKEAFDKIKELLKLKPTDNNAEILGTIRGLLEKITELEKASYPQTIYKYQDKDFVYVMRILGLTIITERAR